MGRLKICWVTPSLTTVKAFLIPHLRAFSKEYDLTLVVNVEDQEYLRLIDLPIRIVHVPIERKIYLKHDLIALFQLVKFFNSEKFDIVHTIAPKAGLLGILAAWLVRVPKRLHVFQGEVWVTKQGGARFILKNIDRIVAFLSTHLLVVSESERHFLISQKIIASKKSVVLGSGSICGVDTNRFKPDLSARKKIRAQLQINDGDLIILYVGRLNKDKGIPEMIQAFVLLDSVMNKKSHLVVVGPDEEKILSSFELILATELNKKIHFLPYTDTPEQYMAASDILVLPSHREGFGLVVIEAAACKVPAVGSRIYGISDAIEDKKTGLLFNLKDVKDLADKLLNLIKNDDLRIRMGEAAYSRCILKFGEQSVVEATLKYYKMNLAKSN